MTTCFDEKVQNGVGKKINLEDEYEGTLYKFIFFPLKIVNDVECQWYEA